MKQTIISSPTTMNKWQIRCFEFVGRQRRLAYLEEKKAPEYLINKEKETIQKVYEEMRSACLEDSVFCATWEKQHEDVVVE